MDPLGTIFRLKRSCVAAFSVAESVVALIKSHLSTVAILLYCRVSVNETCKRVFQMDVNGK